MFLSICQSKYRFKIFLKNQSFIRLLSTDTAIHSAIGSILFTKLLVLFSNTIFSKLCSKMTFEKARIVPTLFARIVIRGFVHFKKKGAGNRNRTPPSIRELTAFNLLSFSITTKQCRNPKLQRLLMP